MLTKRQRVGVLTCSGHTITIVLVKLVSFCSTSLPSPREKEGAQPIGHCDAKEAFGVLTAHRRGVGIYPDLKLQFGAATTLTPNIIAALQVHYLFYQGNTLCVFTCLDSKSKVLSTYMEDLYSV